MTIMLAAGAWASGVLGMACLLGLGIFKGKVKEMGKWLKRKRQTIPSVGKDVEQLKPSYHLVGVNFATALGKTLGNGY